MAHHHHYNLDELRRLRDKAMVSGPGSGCWIKAAQALMDAFPDYYATALAMNERQAHIADAAVGVIMAFERLGKTTDAPGVLVSRAMCENALIKLKEAARKGLEILECSTTFSSKQARDEHGAIERAHGIGQEGGAA